MEKDNPSYNAHSGEETVLPSPDEDKGIAGKRAFISRNLFLRIFAILIVIGITVSIFIFRDQVAELKTYGYLGAFLISLTAAATVILPVPGIVLIAALGTVEGYNPVLIGLSAGAGAALGEITGYIAGYSGQIVAENTELYIRLEKMMNRRGTIILFLFSVFPNPFFDLAGAVAGFLRFPLWKFLLVCFVGKTLMNIGVASLGGWGWSWITENL